MHRSEAFLEAQRTMTRSATEYRLQEREIAEAFCAMHHVPTRTEMDEVQREVYVLRTINVLGGTDRMTIKVPSKSRAVAILDEAMNTPADRG